MSIETWDEIEGITVSLRYLSAMLEGIAVTMVDEEQDATLGCMEYAEGIHARAAGLVDSFYSAKCSE